MKAWKGWMALGALLLVQCVFDTAPMDGGGVETNTLVGLVRYAEGRPAVGVKVRMRSEKYLRDPGGSPLGGEPASKADTFTGNDGRYTLRAPTQGRYYLEINNGESLGALVIVDAPASPGETLLESATLLPTGQISGTVYTGQESPGPGYVQVFGMERNSAIHPGTGEFRLADMPKGTYSLRIIYPSDSTLVKRLDGIGVASGENLRIDPIFMGWSQSRMVLFNTTATGAGLGTSLSDFPVLVRLDKGVFDFSQARSQGQDLRFYLPDGKQVPHEIARWDSLNGNAEVWVRLDTLRANASSSMVMVWGNPGASDISNGNAVFDSASGAKAVFHFDSDSGLTESSGNLARGTNAGARSTSGLAGSGFAFSNPSPNIVTFPHWDGLRASNILESPTGCTFSWWMRSEEDLDSAAGRRDIMAKGLNWDGSIDQDWAVWIENGRVVLEGRTGSGWTRAFSPVPAWEPHTWYHVAVAYDGSQVYWYRDGAPMGPASPYAFDFLTSDDGPILSIGKHHPSFRDDQAFRGMLDEVRIYGRAASAAWVKASYYAQRPEGGLTILAP